MEFDVGPNVSPVISQPGSRFGLRRIPSDLTEGQAARNPLTGSTLVPLRRVVVSSCRRVAEGWSGHRSA